MQMLTTNQKGAIAEAAVAYEAIKLGIDVYTPVSGHTPYDLILDVGGRLLRVQCKWAVHRGDVVVVACIRNRRGPNGFIRRRYEPGEIDVIAAHCAELGTTYLLSRELSVGRAAVQLRLTPARNNQRTGVHRAQDFEFGATLRRLQGPIAQLGER
jgi:PD-(D/E)XK endonuclease